MNIHDILRFPRRIFDVLEDLQSAVVIVRDYATVVAEKQHRDCQAITRGYSDRIEELTARIDELESEARKHADQVAAWKSEEKLWGDTCGDLRVLIAELETSYNNLARVGLESDRKLTAWSESCERLRTQLDAEYSKVTTLSARRDELESQLKSRYSQPLPWRPIGEFEVGRLATFQNRTKSGTSTWSGTMEQPSATHFLYLDGPRPAKPEPKAVAWAVVTENGTLHHHDSYPLVWTSTDPLAESNCQEFCDRKNLIGKYRAVRLAIVEE
jgi:hypothetical protein